MSASAPSLRFVWKSLLLTALIVSIAALLGYDTASAASFNPYGSACLDNADTKDPNPFEPGNAEECDGNPATGANSDITTVFNVDAPDANFAVNISFTPRDWSVAKDADIPDGALAATLDSLATLGLINNPCGGGGPTVVHFDLLDATTNMSQTVTFEDDPADTDTKGEQFEEEGGLPAGVTKYPDYLARILVDGNGNPLQLRARLFGVATPPPGGLDVSLNFALFEPGVNIRGTQLDPALGYPSVTILQAIGDPNSKPIPGSITDFCTPLKATTVTFGLTKDYSKTAANEAGKPFRTNPGANGTFNFTTFAAGQRDADNDGMENALDTCAFSNAKDADPDFNPRIENTQAKHAGDRDGDGIPNSCDPLPDHPGNPGLGGLQDHDGDGYQNRQDNCPLEANSKGYFFNNQEMGTGKPNQKDSDDDGIGDACDTNPNTADGALPFVCKTFPVTVGAGGAAAPAPNLCNEDLVGIDLNGNGKIDSLEPAAPTPTPPPDADGDGVADSADQCPGTPPGATLIAAGCSADQLRTPGLNLKADRSTVTVGGSTVVVAVFADQNNNPLPGEDVTFKIDQQPGSDANLDGQAQVKKPTDAQGIAKATLSAGSKAGTIVVSATAQGQTKTISVTVSEASTGAGEVGGPTTGIGSLAPAASSIPLWGALASALGGAGLLGSLAAFASRILRRRRQ